MFIPEYTYILQSDVKSTIYTTKGKFHAYRCRRRRAVRRPVLLRREQSPTPLTARRPPSCRRRRRQNHCSEASLHSLETEKTEIKSNENYSLYILHFCLEFNCFFNAFLQKINSFSSFSFFYHFLNFFRNIFLKISFY